MFSRILVSRGVLRVAGNDKSHEVIQFLPAESASESGHVGTAVHDPDDRLITGEPVSNVGEVGTAMPAVSGGYGVHFASQLRHPPVVNYVRGLESHEETPANGQVYFVRGNDARARVPSLPPPLMRDDHKVRLLVCRESRIGFLYSRMVAAKMKTRTTTGPTVQRISSEGRPNS